MKKKSLLLRFAVLVAAMMCALGANAYDFIENGIYYKYDGYNTVEVVNDGTDGYFCYSGNVEIPETAYNADDGWYYRVASIGERAFYRCPSLVTVTIPATVDLIHNEAFVDCFDAYPDQSSITCLAQTPPTVSPTAFGSGEQSYVTLYVPYGKKSAYQAAAVWKNFSNIVELPYSFKKDGFYYKITGSNTVCVTYKDANYNTYSGRVLIPKRVTFEDVTYTVTAIDHAAFLGCTGLTSVTIPETVTSIGNTVFSGCTSLESITIPNSVTSIGVYAFENCEGLTEVTLGSGLQSIGVYAFYGCTELMRGNIISMATVPPTIQSTTFETGHYQGASLYVPHGCYDAYANANYWKNFYDIYEIITLEEALNVDGGDIEFTSVGAYPWKGAASDGRLYAVSSNRGVANSTSTLTAEVYVEGNSILLFDFKAWGEGTNAFYDKCIFLIDGEEQFCYGARDNDWETYSLDLAPGEHTLEWRYSKDDSVDPDGDYFAVDNVQIVPCEAYACYTESNTTLTFYYDTQRSSRPGTTYDLNTGDNDTDWYTDGTYSNVTKVVFDPSFADARPTTTFGWFYRMDNLESITGLSYLNTSEVTNMAWMFTYCENLTSLDVSHFNTSQVTNMWAMFSLCSSLTSIDVSNFNTSKVTDMSFMFRGCSGLTSLDLSHFNTSQVTNMSTMFYNSNNLRTIFVGSGWSTAAVTNSKDMFKYCTRLVGGQGTTFNENYIDKTYAHIDGGPSNPGYFTAEGDEPWNGSEAYACYTSSNTTLTFYYDNQRSSRPGTTYDLNTSNHDPDWYKDGTSSNVTKVVFDASFAGACPTTTYSWFYHMFNLQSITGMSYLNTSEVTNMGFMFQSCNQLTSIDVSHFNTSQVFNMRAMFTSCSSLTSLDLSSFNTSQVIYMNSMFNGCSNLTCLDLCSFNTAKVKETDYMFYGCNNLQTVYVGNGWSTAAVTNSEFMFSNCTSLVGGQGTTYNANYIDKTYAHIDGGTSNPGYFTEKNASLRGDVNGDGGVDITDATMLINYLLNGNANGLNMENANCDQNGGVDISDATTLINYLLNGLWP